MSKTEKLNRIFSTPFLKKFIPITNCIITFLRRNTLVLTKYDINTKRYIQKEKNQIIYVDKLMPFWALTFSSLKANLERNFCQEYLPKKGDIVIDIGAGVGTETIVFQQIVGNKGKVFSIEANPETAFSLELLKKFNNCNNISIHKAAIGNKNCFAKIEDREQHVTNSIIRSDHIEGIKVEMKTLDSFVYEQNLDRVDFLKVNIEGAEEMMIDGMKDSVRMIANIAIACHDSLDKNTTGRIRRKVGNFLYENGFIIKFRQTSAAHCCVYAKRIDNR